MHQFMKGQKQLRVITGALFKATSAISYIALILFIVFFLFACGGFIAFSQNDPWHFGNFHLAMLTLFRCATLEDWTDIMYINLYGCDKFGYGGSGMECTTPKASGGLSVAFFVVFIVIGSLVLLSLFIGIITTAMGEARDELAEEDKKAAVLKALTQQAGMKRSAVNNLRVAFEMLDEEGDGSLTFSELQKGVAAAGISLEEDKLLEMLNEVDEDNSGEIDFTEFVEFMMNANHNSKGLPPRVTAAQEIRNKQAAIIADWANLRNERVAQYSKVSTEDMAAASQALRKRAAKPGEPPCPGEGPCRYANDQLLHFCSMVENFLLMKHGERGFDVFREELKTDVRHRLHAAVTASLGSDLSMLGQQQAQAATLAPAMQRDVEGAEVAALAARMDASMAARKIMV